MNKGFTLVELSIVLVIIGLLIGGILVAQSMVETAKSQALIRQLGQYDTAAMNFKTKYNTLPGEGGLVFPVRSQTTGSCVATLNNVLTDDDCLNNTYQMHNTTGSGEIALFWFDLAVLNGLVIESCLDIANKTPGSTSARPLTSGSNCNVPQAKLAVANTSVIPASFAASGGTLEDASKGNAYFMFDCSAMTPGSAFNCAGGFAHAQALSIDAKIDDGVPDTGDVQAGTLSGSLRLSSIVRPSAYSSTNTAKLGLVVKFSNGL